MSYIRPAKGRVVPSMPVEGASNETGATLCRFIVERKVCRDTSSLKRLGNRNSGTYSCTSNGALRFTPFDDETAFQTTVLPMRLCDWKLSLDSSSFAYCGDEVELSVWDSKKALESKASSPASGEKRKRKNDLLPGEIWRAKNVGDIPCYWR